MTTTTSRLPRRLAASVCAAALALGLALVAPTTAGATPAFTPALAAPAPVDPTLLFEETFENGVTSEVSRLVDYVGAQTATYNADAFWLDASACNGLILQSGADWTGAGAPCPPEQGARDRLENLAVALGDGSASNHVVAAYTEASGAADQTLLAQSTNSGITLVQNRFYVASIDIAEVNCFAATDSTIQFGLLLDTGEIVIGGAPSVACVSGQVVTVGNDQIRQGTFYSNGFLAPQAGSAEYIARNLATDGSGNDFAYDNLRFYDATPTLHKEFEDEVVEVGEVVTMVLTVVNTSELGEKTGWSFTDTLPAGMVFADEPNASTTCAAADLDIDAAAGVLTVDNGSIARGSSECSITVDVVLTDGGSHTNVISGAQGLDGEPSATITALVPSISITKSVSPSVLTADNPVATYTFTVVNDGDVDLTDVVVTDPGPVGGNGTMSAIDCGGVTELAVDAELTCSATYTADISDLDGAPLTNTASVAAISPAGNTVGGESTAEVGTVLPKPELTLVKSADLEVATAAGQVITYTFSVTNTGNVTITDVAINEVSFSGAGTLGAVVCGEGAASLAPTETVDCHAQYTVVAADLTGRALTNTATATGTGPFGPLESEPSTVTLPTLVPGQSLPVTGVEGMAPLAALAVVLMLLGGAVVAVRRMQRS